MIPVLRSTRHTGGANLMWVLAVGSLAVVVALAALLAMGRRDKGDQADKLVMYCAAGLRVPVEEAVAAFEKEYGVEIEMQYGGSQTLLSQIEVNRNGQMDLYLAGDDHYTDLARQKGLVAEALPIANTRPVVVVAKGNPKGIVSIDDLLRDDVRSALGSPDQAAIGRATRKRLQAAGKWESLSDNVTARGVFKPTVNEVANDVNRGARDAGIVWDATAAMPAYRDALDVVKTADLDGDPDLITVGVLWASQTPSSALRLARYLSARDKGLPIFGAYGLEPVDGDVWAWAPEIAFFCGSVNRRAVEAVIAAFEQREGVTVNTVYNGCGVLTAQMKTINQDSGGEGFPDTYMACDRYYLENVKDWFQDDADISSADIVIAVAKGNPRGITSLEDLTKEGVRVSVGQPEQCTIGALTRIMLQKIGLYDSVMKNVATQTMSSAMLIPTVTTRSVDATIAYITDTKAESDKVDTIVIESAYAKAIQPFAIARSSDHKYLGRRLFEQIAGARDKFEDAGFRFLYEVGAGAAGEPSKP